MESEWNRLKKAQECPRMLPQNRKQSRANAGCQQARCWQWQATKAGQKLLLRMFTDIRRRNPEKSSPGSSLTACPSILTIPRRRFESSKACKYDVKDAPIQAGSIPCYDEPATERDQRMANGGGRQAAVARGFLLCLRRRLGGRIRSRKEDKECAVDLVCCGVGVCVVVWVVCAFSSGVQA